MKVRRTLTLLLVLLLSVLLSGCGASGYIIDKTNMNDGGCVLTIQYDNNFASEFATDTLSVTLRSQSECDRYSVGDRYPKDSASSNDAYTPAPNEKFMDPWPTSTP